MTKPKIPNAPAGCGPAGRRLWRSVLKDYDLAEHEVALLERACRVADTCAALQRLVDADGPMVEGKVNPALVELRQQSVLLARLVVALRVPIGDQEDQQTTGSPRLQRRGVRGVYEMRSVS